MSDKTKIEWADATCPCYIIKHGTDQRRRDQDCSTKGRYLRKGVSPPDSLGAKVVHELSCLASDIRVFIGSFTMGLSHGELQGVSKQQSKINLCSQAATATRANIRPRAGWRCEASAKAHQLFRRGRPATSPKFALLHRLRSCLVDRRASA
jgi:hypothetical protein